MLSINEELKKSWKICLKYCLPPQPRLEETMVWIAMPEKPGPPCPPTEMGHHTH